MKLFVLMTLAVFASETNVNDIANDSKCGERIGNTDEVVVKIEEDEYFKKKPKYIGVFYDKNKSKWLVQRRNKIEKKNVCNGYYDKDETAAHASDTLARKLMENGEQKLKLNFPDDHTEVYREEKRFTSKFIGVSYYKKNSKWAVYRRSKNENKIVSNGFYDDEKTAAHASDTLARKLMKNGEKKLKLNFPDDHTEVYPTDRNIASKYIGVSYSKNKSKWYVQRHSKNENKYVSNGYYVDDVTAAHASDTLARKLMENGEQKLKLNFPDDHTEVYSAGNQKKRKRQNEMTPEHPQNN